MRGRRKRVDLAERLRPYVDVGPLPEPMVDADPIRMFLYRWMIETGDPIEVVARGFDFDVQLLTDIVERRQGSLAEGQAMALARRLGMRSIALWDLDSNWDQADCANTAITLQR